MLKRQLSNFRKKDLKEMEKKINEKDKNTLGTMLEF